MFFDINKNLCNMFPALEPLKLLDYPADDVFELIAGVIDYNYRNKDENGSGNQKVIRKKAGDDWF